MYFLFSWTNYSKHKRCLQSLKRIVYILCNRYHSWPGWPTRWGYLKNSLLFFSNSFYNPGCGCIISRVKIETPVDRIEYRFTPPLKRIYEIQSALHVCFVWISKTGPSFRQTHLASLRKISQYNSVSIETDQLSLVKY